MSPEVLRRANPRTRNGIRALHTGARFLASAPGRAVTGLIGARLVNGVLDTADLPDYP